MSRVAAAIIVIVILIIAGVGVYVATRPAPTTGSSSSTAPTTSATGTGTTSAATSASSSHSAPSVLTIDDISWPQGDLNQLTSIGAIPYPDWLTYTVYQSLVTLNGTQLYSTGNIQVLPMLATNWTVSSDGRTYNFTLRPGVTFSNGDPFNSYQIWGEMYGFYYLSANNSGFMVAYDVFNFSGVNFGPATIALMNQSGLNSPSPSLLSVMRNSAWPIYAPDANHIVFHLKAPFQWFPQTQVMFTGLLFDTDWLLKHGGFGTPAAYNPYFNQHPMPGTGPYVVRNVVEGSYVQFQQNPTYWGKNLTAAQVQANPYLDPGHVPSVIVNAKTDDLARYTDLSTGTAQVAGIQSQDWPLILNNPSKYSYLTMPAKDMALVGIAMNVLRYPTNVTLIRQAIVHAINYSEIAKKVFFGGLSPMMGPEYPSQSPYYDLGNITPYQYNLTLAQQDVAASHVNTANLAPLDFRVLSGCNFCVSTAELVQADLANIGIPLNIIVTPSAQYAPPYTAGSGSFALAVNNSQTVSQLTWFGSATFAPDEPTPADSWIVWVNNHTVANNWAIYQSPQAQSCVDSWLNGTTQANLLSHCTVAQAKIAQDAPYVWLGSIRLAFGAGSVAWQKSVVKSFVIDPVFTGQTETPIFNTVTFVGS